MKNKEIGLKLKKLTMIVMCLCLLQSVAFVDAKPPAKSGYIPFSRADTPEGKAYTYKTQNGKDLQIEVYFPEGHNSSITAADQFLEQLGLIEVEPTMIAPDAEISLTSAL